MKYLLYFLAIATLSIGLIVAINYVDALRAEKAANLAFAEKTNYELQQKISLDKKEEDARILADHQGEIEIAQQIEENVRHHEEQPKSVFSPNKSRING